MTPIHFPTQHHKEEEEENIYRVTRVYEMIQFLEEFHVNFSEITLLLQNGYTPLHIAARKNELEIAQLLLDQKADAGALSKVRYMFVF